MNSISNFFFFIIYIYIYIFCDRIPILEEIVCVSYGVNTLRKGMYPTIHPQTMDKYGGRVSFFNSWYGNRSRKKKTLNSKPLNFAKKIDLVSHPSCAEGLYIYIYIYIGSISSLIQIS